MFFGGALMAESRHALLGARAFGYVSAGFGFGGGGAGAARQQCAGQNKSGDEEDDETKPKCHWSHCHLGYPKKIFCTAVDGSTRFSVASFVLMCLSSIAPAKKEGRNWNGKIDNQRSTRKSILIAIVKEIFYRAQLLFLLVPK